MYLLLVSVGKHLGGQHKPADRVHGDESVVRQAEHRQVQKGNLILLNGIETRLEGVIWDAALRTVKSQQCLLQTAAPLGR